MNPEIEAESQSYYQIKLQGQLDERWSDWLGNVAFSYEGRSEEFPTTVLTMTIADQAALRGILNSLWDLNLTLLSISRLDEASDT